MSKSLVTLGRCLRIQAFFLWLISAKARFLFMAFFFVLLFNSFFHCQFFFRKTIRLELKSRVHKSRRERERLWELSGRLA